MCSIEHTIEVILDQSIDYDKSRKQWVIFGRYYYDRLLDLAAKESLLPLLEVVYKVKIPDIKQLDYEVVFHDLSLVKKQS